jgi:hypothetical protein
LKYGTCGQKRLFRTEIGVGVTGVRAGNPSAFKSETGPSYLLFLPYWAVRHLTIEVLEHAPYIPDLTSSSNHVSGPVDVVSSGRRFASDQQVTSDTCTACQPTNFFKGLQKCVSWCAMCFGNKSDYLKRVSEGPPAVLMVVFGLRLSNCLR